MPDYTRKDNAPERLELKFPSNPACKIWGRGRLGWTARKRCESQAITSDDEGRSIFNPAMLQVAIVQNWVEQDGTAWDVTTNGATSLLNMSTLAGDNALIDPDDVEQLSLKLAQTFYPMYFPSEGETLPPQQTEAGHDNATPTTPGTLTSEKTTSPSSMTESPSSVPMPLGLVPTPSEQTASLTT